MTLTPKAVEVLIALVEARGNLVAKEELLQKIWADTIVEEGTLTYHVSLLRKALGEGPGEHQFIETIPKRGYRFVGELKESQEPACFAPGKVMLAVLPFENLSGQKSQEYLSDGLTEETITQLGKLNPEQLGVIARTSAMQYRSTKKSVREIARELGVAYVLEGSVRRAGNRVRIATQLIQVSDETHLWAESYERNLGDILALQLEVAEAVAKEIGIKLVPQERERRSSASSIRPEAYEAYLKGRYLLNRRTYEALQNSVRYFQESIEHDPQYAVAYAGLADSYLTLQDFGYLRPAQATTKAKASARKALGMDETLAEAHTSLGHALFHEFNWLTAEKEFRRAIQLNPNYAHARFYYSNHLLAMGRSEQAITEARSAHALDPVSLPTGQNVAIILFQGGHYREAIEESLRVIAMDSHYARAHEDLGRIYEQQGMYPQALAALEKAVACSGRSSLGLASLAHACAVAGKKKEALRLLQELKDASKNRYVSPHAMALVYAVLGNKDQAFAWLEKAYEGRDQALPFLRVNPRWNPLHSDRRFLDLVRRMKFPA